MTLERMRILVALAVPKSLGVAVGIHQVHRHRASPILIDLFLNLPVRSYGIGLRRSGQIDDSLSNRVPAFWHTDIFIVLRCSIGHQDRVGVSHANILTGKDDQPPENKSRVLSRQ